MNRRKTAPLQLPVHKQGDYLGHCLRQQGTVREALRAYSDLLSEARAMVLALSVHAHRLQIVQADTHFIEIEGPAGLVDKLIRVGLHSPIDSDLDD